MDDGCVLGHGKAGSPAGALEAIQGAERLGFDSVWTADAYGSAAFTPREQVAILRSIMAREQYLAARLGRRSRPAA